MNSRRIAVLLLYFSIQNGDLLPRSIGIDARAKLDGALSDAAKRSSLFEIENRQVSDRLWQSFQRLDKSIQDQILTRIDKGVPARLANYLSAQRRLDPSGKSIEVANHFAATFTWLYVVHDDLQYAAIITPRDPDVVVERIETVNKIEFPGPGPNAVAKSRGFVAPYLRGYVRIVGYRSEERKRPAIWAIRGVAETETLAYPAESRKGYGLLDIASEPSKANIFLDKTQHDGRTNDKIWYPASPEVSIRLTKEGFDDWTDKVSLEDGETSIVRAAMKKR